MKKPTILKWSFGGVLLVVFAFVALPIVLNARRPKQVTFDIGHSYSRSLTVEDAFELSAITRNWVVNEGPCPVGSCNGGVLQPLDKQAARDYDVIPPMPDGADNSNLVWLYRIEPLKSSGTTT